VAEPSKRAVGNSGMTFFVVTNASKVKRPHSHEIMTAYFSG
jgi:hypothetical protein